MQFEYAFKTDIGRRRKQNQDSGIACPELGLFIVADGMGGHQGGETASSMVTELIPESIRESQKHKRFQPESAIKTALERCNEAIYERSQKDPALHGMGTTTTAILIHDKTLTVAQVGDSRAYYLKADNIWQLTRDHSLVQEKLRAGLINREQLKKDQHRNVITRSVGFEPDVKVETFQMKVQSGDVFLLCSDGLSGPIEDRELLEIVSPSATQSGASLTEAANSLIARANERGGDDNITVILVKIV